LRSQPRTQIHASPIPPAAGGRSWGTAPSNQPRSPRRSRFGPRARIVEERCNRREMQQSAKRCPPCGLAQGKPLGLRRVACPLNPSACTTLLAEKLPAPIRVNEVGRKGPMGAGGEPLLPARSAGAGLSCRARDPSPSAPGAAAGTRPCPFGRCCL